LCGVGITFNCTNGSPSKELSSQYASASACEKSQLIHFFPFLRRPTSADFSKTANTSVKRTFIPLRFIHATYLQR